MDTTGALHAALDVLGLPRGPITNLGELANRIMDSRRFHVGADRMIATDRAGMLGEFPYQSPRELAAAILLLVDFQEPVFEAADALLAEVLVPRLPAPFTLDAPDVRRWLRARCAPAVPSPVPDKE